MTLSRILSAILALVLYSPIQALSQCQTPPAGMTNWWDGDNGALDIVGTHNGTLIGDTTYVEGKVGQAYSFDGVGDYVALPVSTDWDFGTSSFTINAWFKPPTVAGTYHNIIRYHSGGGTDGFWGLRTNFGKIEFLIADASGVGYLSSITTTSTYNDNSWHFVTAVRDGGQLRMYVDGVEAATPVSDGNWNIVASPGVYPTIGAGGFFGAEYFTGLIDELQVFGRGLTLAEHQDAYNAGAAGTCKSCKTLPSGAISWWRGENNGADSTGTNEGTLVNGVAFMDGKFGRALSLDGTNDHVVVNDVSFPAGNTPRTISLWAKTSQSGENYLFSYGSNVSNQRFSLGVRNGKLYVENTGTGMGGDAIVNDNEWHHLAVVWNGSALTMYVDGQLQTLTEPVGPFPDTLNTTLTGTANIGRVNGIDGYYYNGLIDDAIIYNGALTAEEVSGIYTAQGTGICGSCVDQPSGMTSWWGADGNAVDMVGTNDGTLVDNTTYSAGMVGQAFSFDGDGDYVSIPDSASLDITEAITIDAWIFRADAGSNQGLLKKGPPGANGVYSLALYLNRFHFLLNIADLNMGSTATIPVGVWTHVAATYDGATAKIYINGALDASQAYSGPIATDDNPLRLGLYGAPNYGYFNGQIDELEIFNRALSSGEINAIYTAGSAGKCRSCFDRPAGLAAWWQAEGDGTDFMGTSDGTVTGATFAAGKIGQAFSFDGSNDYVDLPPQTALLLNDTAGSIMVWVKPSSVADNDMIVAFGGDSPGKGVGVGIYYGNVRIFHYTGTYDWQSTIPVAANEWTFLTYTWDDTTERIYKNGMFSDSRPRNFSYDPVHARIGHGWWNDSANAFPGLIDELQIFDRTLTAAEIVDAYNACNAGLCQFRELIFGDGFESLIVK